MNTQITTNDVQNVEQELEQESNCCSNSCFSSENCTWTKILNSLKCWTWECNPH